MMPSCILAHEYSFEIQQRKFEPFVLDVEATLPLAPAQHFSWFWEIWEHFYIDSLTLSRLLRLSSVASPFYNNCCYYCTATAFFIMNGLTLSKIM